MGKQYLLAFVVPGVLGVGAFAAILLTDGTEDLSPVRFTVAAVTLAVVWFGGGFLLGKRAYDRDIARIESDPGPDCDRCGKPTGKPFLYNTPRTYWRCETCEQEVTDIVIRAAEDGTLTEEMLRYAKADQALTAMDRALTDVFRKLGPPPANTTEK